MKLSRGLYYIVPIHADPKNYIPDWHLVAKYLVKGNEYYIGFYSAMQIHGLITQPSLKEIIVTKEQIVPSLKKIQGIDFQFITQVESRFFGYKKTWINAHDKVMVSDLEKTIVDAVTKPHLCDGMVEVGKAIYETRNKVSLEKLLDYFTRTNNKAAVKRYLFICDLMAIDWTEYHESIWKLRGTGTSFPLLDTTAPNKGQENHHFGLKINVDTETIKNAIYT